MKRYALVGHPVAGSLSPAMHNAAFRALGLEAVYELWDTGPGELASVFQRAAGSNPGGICGGGICGGLNVTAPHKVVAAGFCGRLAGPARAAGAVNTVVFEGDGGEGEPPLRGCTGHNTDVLAVRSLAGEWAGGGSASGTARAGFRAAILGAGGAARAAAVGLALAGAREVVLSARTLERAAQVAADLSRTAGGWGCAPGDAGCAPGDAGCAPGDAGCAPGDSGGGPGGSGGCGATSFRPALIGALAAGRLGRDFDLVIQASSAPDGALGPFTWLRPGSLAVEFNYRPRRTRFLAAALEAGARAVDGLEVLLRQGEAAFSLFTGFAPPAGVMRRALETAFRHREGEPPCSDS